MFVETEVGESVVEAPRTALAEVLCSVFRDENVRETTLSATPENVYRALIGNGLVSVAPVDDEELTEYPKLGHGFSVRDGLIVVSHRAQRTDATLTTDGVVCDAGYDAVWE